MLGKITAVSVLMSITFSVSAQMSCADYPYSDGINVEEVEGGTKILATASASVSFDDIDSIKDAREEAEMEAKAAISKFLTEDIKTDSNITKVVNESKSTNGEQSERTRTELIERVKRLSNSSQALLRGVVPLGDCYTKGREVRVSVGMKPETIRAAEKTAGAISNSIAAQPTPTAGNTNPSGPSQGIAPQGSGGSQPLRSMDGYSNTDRLKNF